MRVDRITPELRAFARELVPTADVRFVPALEVATAQSKECIPNVDEQVRTKGGSRCLGWAFWTFPRLYLEAEFHAVWCDPAERLHHIAPPTEQVGRIAFVPDSALTYDGRQIRKRYHALLDHPALGDVFRAIDAQFEIFNRGDRAYQYGRVELGDKEKDEWLAAEELRKLALSRALGALRPPGRNDPCSCGSGKKFKKCHGA